MSLVVELVNALCDKTLSPELVAEWEKCGQRCWEQETDGLAMARLCFLTDLALGVRVTCACVRAKQICTYEDELSLVERWAAGEDVEEGALWGAICSIDDGIEGRLPNDSELVANFVVRAAYNAHNGCVEQTAYELSEARWVHTIYRGLVADPIRLVAPAAPSITFCKECRAPATYTRTWLTASARERNERTQVHWQESVEAACKPTRVLAEYVRAGLSPLDFMYGDYDVREAKRKNQIHRGQPHPFLGDNTLRLLEEVATGMSPTGQRPKPRLQEAWARCQAVLSGSPWRETGPSESG